MKREPAETFFYEDIHRANLDVPYVDTAMTDIDYCAHYHEELEIILVTDGEVAVTVDGRCEIATAGDVVIVFPFRIHSYTTPTRSRLYVLKILSPMYDFSRLHMDNFIRKPVAGGADYLRDGILHLVYEHEREEEATLHRLALKTAADTLLVRIARLPDCRVVTADHAAAHDREIDMLRTINLYLHDHYRESITLETAASVCHRSVYYFAHTFKAITGTTFLAYLTAFRLELAKKRMIETVAPLTEIALQCGFASVRTFNRCFSSHYRMTPSEARRRWTEGKRS